MKKKLKSLLGIVLAVTIVLTTVLSAIPMSVSALDIVTHSFKNGGFETGDLTGWDGSSEYFSVVEHTTQTPALDSSNKRYGTYALKGNGGYKYISQKIDVEPNTDYTIYVRYYSENGAHNIYKVMTADWSQIISNNGDEMFGSTSASWYWQTINFNSGSNTQVVFALGVNGVVYFDAISIQEKANLFNNGDLETGSCDERWHSNVQSIFVNDGANGSDYAVRPNTNDNTGTFRKQLSVDQNSQYIFQFYAKLAPGESTASGSVRWMNNNWVEIENNAPAVTSEWKLFRYVVNSGNNAILIFQFLAGNIYYDNIALYKAVSVSAAAEGNGTAEIVGAVGSQYTYATNPLTFKATPGPGCNFLGWFNGTEKVSEELEYNVKTATALSLTAKFEAANKIPLPNGDFEVEGGAINSTYGWTSVATSLNPEIVSTDANSGSKSMHMSYTGTGYSNAYYKFNVTPGEAYKFRFYAKVSGYAQAQLGTSQGNSNELVGTFGLSGNSWKEYVVEIPATNTSANVYFRINSAGQNLEMYLDDMEVAKAVEVSATAGENGAASYKNQYGTVNPANVLYGDKITFVAAPNAGYSLEGWYKDTEKVSSDSEYTVDVFSALSLNAKFEVAKKIELTNSDFEAEDGATPGWGSWDGNLTSHDITTEDPHTGNKSLHVVCEDAGYKAFYLTLNVLPGEEYTLRFFYKNVSGLSQVSVGTDKWNNGCADVVGATELSANNWTEKLITIPASNTAATIHVKFSGSNSAFDLYLDDFTLAKLTNVSVTVDPSANKGALTYRNQYKEIDPAKKTTFLYGDRIIAVAVANNSEMYTVGWKNSGSNEVFSNDNVYEFLANNQNVVVEFKFDGLGDLDGNDHVDDTDINLLRKVILGRLSGGNGYDEAGADAFVNGTVDILDLLKTVYRADLFIAEYKITNLTTVTEELLVNEKIEMKADLKGLDSTLNVFDEADVDYSIKLTSESGKVVEADGFYYEDYTFSAEGAIENRVGSDFRLRFTLPEAGEWNYEVTYKIKGEVLDTATGSITVVENAANKGYLAVEPTHNQTFAFEDGTPYVAVGENTAGSYGAYATRSEQMINWMDKSAAEGANFTRIWMSQWLLSIQQNGYAPGNFAGGMDDAAQLDRIVEAWEANGMYGQIVFFTHQQLCTNSSDASQNAFVDFPYNAENNGGYLNTPAEFFTNAQAIKDTKSYIRYIVSRYGYSTNILAWELINEADGCTGYNEADVLDWHKDMAGYIRSIDGNHMITTSTANNTALTFDETFDFISLHNYNYTSVAALANLQKNYQQQYSKPVMISECGDTVNHLGTDLANFHQQNWIGVMGGGAGTAATWWWEEVDSQNAYSEFKAVSDMAKRIKWTDSSFAALTSSDYRMTNANVEVLGYSGDDFVFAWLYDKNYYNSDATANSITGFQTMFKVDVTGTYAVRWYDTRTGANVKTEYVNPTNGELWIGAAQMPSWSKDIAVAITKTGN